MLAIEEDPEALAAARLLAAQLRDWVTGEAALQGMREMWVQFDSRLQAMPT